MAKNKNGIFQETTFKEQILTKIRNAVVGKTEQLFHDLDLRTDTKPPINEEVGEAVTFATKFLENGGLFIYTESEKEFAARMRQYIQEMGWNKIWCADSKMQDILDRNDIAYHKEYCKCDNGAVVGITTCEGITARTGSVILAGNKISERQVYSMSTTLIAYATIDQIFTSLKDGMTNIRRKNPDKMPSQIVIMSGAGYTNAIEGENIVRAQGARKFALFLVDAID